MLAPLSLFDRYILRQAVSALLLILLSLTAIVWISLALRQLSVVTGDGQSAGVFLSLTLLILPDIMAIIAPIALLIAALHTLNRLNTDSELIVMTAAGATVWHYARPLAIVGLGVTLAVAVANFWLTPWSLRALNEVANRVRTDLISQVLQPGRFASPEDGLTFHIRDRDQSGRMLGVILSDTREKDQQMTYLAETGEILKQDGRNLLVLQRGQIVQRSRGGATGLIDFDSYVIDLAIMSATDRAEGPKPHARYLGELLDPDPEDYYYKRNPGSFRAELHERFASLLYPPLFVLIVAAFLGQARTNRQSRSQSLVSAFVMAAGLKVGGITATNMASLQDWALVLVYGLPLGAIALAALAAQRGMAPRRASRLEVLAGELGERLAGVVGQALGRLRLRRRQSGSRA